MREVRDDLQGKVHRGTGVTLEDEKSRCGKEHCRKREGDLACGGRNPDLRGFQSRALLQRQGRLVFLSWQPQCGKGLYPCNACLA